MGISLNESYQYQGPFVINISSDLIWTCKMLTFTHFTRQNNWSPYQRSKPRCHSQLQNLGEQEIRKRQDITTPKMFHKVWFKINTESKRQKVKDSCKHFKIPIIIFEPPKNLRRTNLFGFHGGSVNPVCIYHCIALLHIITGCVTL